MSKTIFLGLYRTPLDGWGNAAFQWASAMITLEDLSLTPFNYQNNKGPIPQYLSDKEDIIGFNDADIIIQNCLPSHFNYYSGKKNIGLIYIESTITDSPWVEKCNMMDQIWVTTDKEAHLLSMSDVKTDVTIVDQPYDLRPRTRQRQKDYGFYFIGGATERKNITDLLLAFIIAFRNYDEGDLPVLYLKSDPRIKELILEFNTKYRIQCPQLSSRIILESRSVSDQQILKIHEDNHCFVCLSHGESVNLPMIQALAKGNSTIVTANTGMDNGYEGYHVHNVDSYTTPCFSKSPPLPFLYTGVQTWVTPDVHEAAMAMRYEFSKNRSCDTDENVIDRHSYDRVLTQIKKALND